MEELSHSPDDVHVMKTTRKWHNKNYLLLFLKSSLQLFTCNLSIQNYPFCRDSVANGMVTSSYKKCASMHTKLFVATFEKIKLKRWFELT